MGKGRGTMSYGYKHRRYVTPAGEPTPATAYMLRNSLDSGDVYLARADWCATRLESPELALCEAILAEAIKDFGRFGRLSARHPKHRIYREARLWIWSTDRSWPFSFVNICDCLGIDGDDLRRRLELARVAAAEKGHSCPYAVSSYHARK